MSRLVGICTDGVTGEWKDLWVDMLLDGLAPGWVIGG